MERSFDAAAVQNGPFTVVARQIQIPLVQLDVITIRRQVFYSDPIRRLASPQEHHSSRVFGGVALFANGKCRLGGCLDVMLQLHSREPNNRQRLAGNDDRAGWLSVANQIEPVAGTGGLRAFGPRPASRNQQRRQSQDCCPLHVVFPKTTDSDFRSKRLFSLPNRHAGAKRWRNRRSWWAYRQLRLQSAWCRRRTRRWNPCSMRTRDASHLWTSSARRIL